MLVVLLRLHCLLCLHYHQKFPTVQLVVRQWGIANLNNVSNFPISFMQLRKLVALHYGSIITVTLIEDINYRNDLTSTKLLTSYEYNADAEYIVIGF